MGNDMSQILDIPTGGLDRLPDIANNGGWGDVLISALNTGNGLMQARIFRENKDVEGNDFGIYIGNKKNLTAAAKLKLLSSTTSRTDLKRIKANIDLALTPYQRKRVNKGRQIGHKDLEFTGGLRKSIEIQLESENVGVITFNYDKAAQTAQGQENQITNIRNGLKGTTQGNGTKIFALNTDEKSNVSEQVHLLVKQKISL